MGQRQEKDPTRSTGRDAEATRRRILDAATEEFSAKGLAGGRIATIAERAQSNQRMIYAYYGNKDGLFDAVLEHHILAAQNAVALDATDLPGYAQQVFDVYRSNPYFVRLMLWQFLERPDLTRSLPGVGRAVADKVAAIEAAQAAGMVSAQLPADRLLDHILALTLGNIAGNPCAWSDDERQALGHSVALLTDPAPFQRT
ncbi:TetR/AcrR family transcriptional regulator [Streptomyces sp. Inha503]|uniref:TetR/AcrR family transcriptional regulator n=1 Tax=Streptomyces sp. Inha503 TaxID=3383314 RepID=UPI0039A30EF4